MSARLLGSYLAMHTLGWTEFEIDEATQVLTVTTYGTPKYTEENFDQSEPNAILQDHQPAVVSRFEVAPRSGGKPSKDGLGDCDPDCLPGDLCARW